MSKYRIKIKEYSDGVKKYLPQKKGLLWGWNCLSIHYCQAGSWEEWLETENEAKKYIKEDKITCKNYYKIIK